MFSTCGIARHRVLVQLLQTQVLITKSVGETLDKSIARDLVLIAALAAATTADTSAVDTILHLRHIDARLRIGSSTTDSLGFPTQPRHPYG